MNWILGRRVLGIRGHCQFFHQELALIPNPTKQTNGIWTYHREHRFSFNQHGQAYPTWKRGHRSSRIRFQAWCCETETGSMFFICKNSNSLNALFFPMLCNFVWWTGILKILNQQHNSILFLPGVKRIFSALVHLSEWSPTNAKKKDSIPTIEWRLYNHVLCATHSENTQDT